MLFRPLSTGSKKIHLHLVDVDSMEIVGAWLATATAMPPVVTKSYDVDLPVGRACHKRIAYSNPWNATKLFRLHSSDSSVLRPRYESLEVWCVDRSLLASSWGGNSGNLVWNMNRTDIPD